MTTAALDFRGAAALEFVGVGNDTNVRSFFHRLANATNDALGEIVATNATTDYFLLLGASLHAVQNFYAHRFVDSAQSRPIIGR